MAYIALDVGTTGCKATVIDAFGKPLYAGYHEYDLVFPQPGWIEINANRVFNSVCAVLADVGMQGIPELSALAIASFGEAVILLDENDKVLDNSIYYSDVRGSAEISDILEKLDHTSIQRITGMPVNSMYSLNKLLWITKHKPELLKKARRFMLFGDYIGFRLSGEACIDFSLASRSMMFDIDRKQWSESIFNCFGFDRERFSKPIASGTIYGNIRPEIARKLSLNPDLRIVTGGHDQACAALGTGAIEAGQATIGMGASDCLVAVLDKEQAESDMYADNFCREPHVVGDNYITLAFTTTSGAALKWYRDTFEKYRHAENIQCSVNTYARLDEECPDAPTGLLFLPHMAGSGTPAMDSNSSGAFLGLRLSTTKSQMYKAIMEGICFEGKYNLEKLAQHGIAVAHLVAAGGGACSQTFLQIKADITGLDIETAAVTEAGTLGLGILCALALKDYPDVRSAVASMTRTMDHYAPDPVRHAQYENYYRHYKRIYQTCNTIWEE